MRFMVAHGHTFFWQRLDGLLGVLEREPVDQVDLGADRPVGPGRRPAHLLDDELGRAGEIGASHDVERALGMDQHLDCGIGRARLLDLLHRELGVHGADPRHRMTRVSGRKPRALTRSRSSAR